MALLAAALVFLLPQPPAANASACPLTKGIVINGDGTLWPVGLDDSIRSDRTKAESMYGPVSIDLPKGDYDVVLVSYDDHSVPRNQNEEMWYIDLYADEAGTEFLFASDPISDLPNGQDILIEVVATSVTLEAAKSIEVRHAAYPNKDSENSIVPLCLAFVQAGFLDDDGSVFESDIEWMFRNGYTNGCNPEKTEYCPKDPLTRGQMAQFLATILGLTERSDNPFDDDDGSIFEPAIEKLHYAGITDGCGTPADRTFCPRDNIKRGQVAKFLAEAFDLVDRSDNPFTDDDGSIFESHIERLHAARVTSGCNPEGTLFCPRDLVTRGQIAKFLHRLLG